MTSAGGTLGSRGGASGAGDWLGGGTEPGRAGVVLVAAGKVAGDELDVLFAGAWGCRGTATESGTAARGPEEGVEARASGAMPTTKRVWPDLISSPLARSMASRILAPFRYVPLVLFLSTRRQPSKPYSTAKCRPDIRLSCGTANCARSEARPVTTDSPLASEIVFPASGPALICRRMAMRSPPEFQTITSSNGRR